MVGKADARRAVALGDDESPVGWVSFGGSRDDDRSDAIGEIYALYVHPESWGRGAGRALVRHVVAELPGMGYEEATLWSFAVNERAKRLYESAGFRRDGAEVHEPIFANALEVRYRRSL
jgi:ribosomal protein S18 acetylase RimI-like enzyme